MRGYRTLKPQDDASKQPVTESKQLATAREVVDASKKPTEKTPLTEGTSKKPADATSKKLADATSKKPGDATSKRPEKSKVLTTKSAAVTSKASSATSSAMPANYKPPQLLVDPRDMPLSVGPTKKGDTIKVPDRPKQELDARGDQDKKMGDKDARRPFPPYPALGKFDRHGKHAGHHRGMPHSPGRGRPPFGDQWPDRVLVPPPEPQRKSRRCLVIFLCILLFVLIIFAVGLVVGLSYNRNGSTTTPPPSTTSHSTRRNTP